MDSKQAAILVLEQERSQLLEKLNSLELTILMLKQSLAVPNPSDKNSLDILKAYTHGEVNHTQNGNDPKYAKYFSAKSNKGKVVAILGAEKRFLHIRQLIRIAQSLEPKVNPEALAKQISGAVYNLKAMEDSPVTSVTINNNNQNTFWGSKNWLNADGTIKKEFMYDESELSVGRTESIEI